jgi:hypothetical protein
MGGTEDPLRDAYVVNGRSERTTHWKSPLPYDTLVHLGLGGRGEALPLSALWPRHAQPQVREDAHPTLKVLIAARQVAGAGQCDGGPRYRQHQDPRHRRRHLQPPSVCAPSRVIPVPRCYRTLKK